MIKMTCQETKTNKTETNKTDSQGKNQKKDREKEGQEEGLIVGWSLTNICNLSCMHCYNDSGKKRGYELTTKEALSVVDKLAEGNVKAVNFGGGECALRPDFLEICRALFEKNIKISYTTNGTTLDKFSQALYLFYDIGVSIDFAEQKAHDIFRVKEGTFDKAVKCIDTLVGEGVNTEMVTCLSKRNCSEKELSKLYNLAKAHKVNFWRLNRYRATGRALFNNEFLSLNEKNQKEAYDFLNSIRSSSLSPISEPLFRAIYGGSYQIEGDPSGRFSFRIQANGDVTPSVFLSTSGGNMLEKSIDEIRESDIFKQIRNRTPEGKCVSCKEYYHCQGGDAGISYITNNHFNGPDPLCFKDTSLPKNDSVKKILAEKPNVHELYLCTLYISIRG